MWRRVGLILLGVALTLTVLGARRAWRANARAKAAAVTTHATHAHDGGAAANRLTIDWTNATLADAALARVFSTAQAQGLAAALDSLRSIAQRDSTVADLGPVGLHHAAHMLGRFAFARDPAGVGVFAQCGPGFLAGCQHGVMEAYFASHPPTDPASLAALCVRVAPESPAIAARECAHGVGHGLMTTATGDVTRALTMCDALAAGIMQRECSDGVFMTAVQRDIAAVARTTGAATARCAPFDARYQESCWSYQPAYSLTRARNDVAVAANDCNAAPGPSRNACFWGLGKQIAGASPDDLQRIASACSALAPEPADACRAGAVTYFTDESWTAERANAFCAVTDPAVRARCSADAAEAMTLRSRT